MLARNAKLSGIGLRMRPDLIVHRQQSAAAGRLVWIIKDPVSLRYFTLSAQEYAILRWLGDALSLDDLRGKFESSFPPLRISPQQLQRFLSNLYENGLLLASGPDHGRLLLERDSRQRSRENWQEWANFFALRFRGIDPDQLLNWLYPRLSWCFSTWFLGVCLISMLAAFTLIFSHATEFRQQIPEFQKLLQPSNLFWLLIAFAGAKVFHEFGHALTCKHFGGECHEMGVMLLLFTPTLYCNVTDSWILRSRWQRIAVSAAGIVVEIQLAAIAVFCWWYSQPGIVHAVALNTIVVCSIGTVLFNGNPLLRYDGYFILADLLEMPNLWQDSRAEVKRLLSKWFLVSETVVPSDPFNRRIVLAIYGFASIAYRGFILIAILLFSYRSLMPRGFGILIPVVAAALISTSVVLWLGKVWRFWKQPRAWRLFRPIRALVSICLAAVCAWGFLTVALPCQISAPGLLLPVAANRIYVATPGTLEKCVAPGESVIAGQVLARLNDTELCREIERLQGEQSVAKIRVKTLQTRLNDEPEVAAQLVIAQEVLGDIQHQLAQRQLDAQALLLVTPAAGIVMEPPEMNTPPAPDQNLPGWIGTPLDPSNQHCYLERGTLVCLVGNPESQEAEAFVDETDVQYVRVGQRVKLQFAVAPSVVFTGRVEEIAKRNITTVPREMTIEQELPSHPNSVGGRRPVRTSYSIRVSLDDCQERLLTGARGRAKIEIDPQTLAQRMLRALRRTLTMPM